MVGIVVEYEFCGKRVNLFTSSLEFTKFELQGNEEYVLTMKLASKYVIIRVLLNMSRQ